MGKLLIAEDFYSLQMEGITTGYPAYFIRLANCNLSCGASGAFVNKFKRGEVEHDPGSFKGDLHASGDASWTCDTIPIWARGVERDYDYLIQKWKDLGIYDDIKSGIIHIIWTGGEPTIPMHQKAIVGFHNYWSNIVFSGTDYLEYSPYVEIETNGTIIIDPELMEQLDQINCSPKLANSGMPAVSRIKPLAINAIKSHLNYQFKFVVSTEDDIKEVFDTFIKPMEIPLRYVVMMPGLDSRADYFERTKFIAEMAIKYKFIGLSRQHIAVWDKTTGV